jgi:glucose-1-phosphate thymidylyltransferase
LVVQCFGRGFAWLDTGTHESLIQAAEFVRTIEQRQGFKIACIEEVALHMGFIGVDQLATLARPMNNSYGSYLRQIVADSGSPGQDSNLKAPGSDIRSDRREAA